MTCDFQQCGILTSVDSDEPVQPPYKLRNSKLCLISSLTVIEYSSDKQRLWSDCAYAQAGLRLCLSHIPHCWKPHVTAYISKASYEGHPSKLCTQSLLHFTAFHIGDNCIQHFHLGRYIVGYTVGNLVLQQPASGAVKHDYQTSIRRYSSQNEIFEYGYPHSNALLQFLLKLERYNHFFFLCWYIYGPRHRKSCLRGFRQSEFQTSLLSHRD